MAKDEEVADIKEERGKGMNKTINVSVRNKIAVLTNDVLYICGNSDFVVDFDFDDEWDEFYAKTARFIYGGQYVDVVFEGNQCAVPVISNTYSFLIGVFAGNLRTTTPAYISAKKSILCEGGLPAAPTDDVYAQMVEMFNEGMVKVAKVEAKADATEQAKVDAQAAQKAAEKAKGSAETAKKGAEDAKTDAETARKGAEEAQQKAEETVGSCVSYLEQEPTDEEKAQARKNIGAVESWCENIAPEMTGYSYDLGYKFPSDFKLTYGEEYIVSFNGVKYHCVGYYVWDGNGGKVSCIGGSPDYPFQVREMFPSEAEKYPNCYAAVNVRDVNKKITISIYHVSGTVIHPIPMKFLPDEVAATVERTARAFSTEEIGDTLTWDGNTDRLDVCDQYYRVFGKVKSIAENIELFTSDNATYLDSDGGAYTGNYFTQTDDHINFGHVIITLKDNAFVPYCGMSFPRKGVYFYGRVESADSGFVHVSSFTVPGFNFTNEEMDDEFLPDSVVQNGATSLTLASPRGILFNITVDNSGNITATKVTT